MSIIRRGDLHKRAPPHSPYAGELRGGITFIEAFIVVGIVVTLGVAIYVAVATDRQIMQMRRVTRFVR